MFFNISTESDSAFPNNYNYSSAYVNCDDGWTEYRFDNRVVLSKGYADHYSLHVLANDITLTDTGNYCLIDISDKITVRHNINRGFPLGYKQNTLTNLFKDSDYTTVWINDVVSIHRPWLINIEKISIDTCVPNDVLSIDQVTDHLFNILNQDVVDFYETNRPNLKVWCSGGIDTLLMYSLLYHNNKSFDLIKDEKHSLFKYDPIEKDSTISTDYFYQNSHELLNQYWGYKQMHYWTEPSWLATGSHGDEYFLRGPSIVAMLTAWHDIEFMRYIKPNDYHYYHFSKYKDLWNQSWANRKELQSQYPSRESLNQHIVNILLYDHQFWHLGNTLTWTLFKNINLVKTMLQCPIDQLLTQFTDAKITKSLIEKVDTNLLTALSNQKNINNYENLQKLYDFHEKIPLKSIT